MNVFRKDSGRHPCSTCIHAHHGQCGLYRNDVTGDDASCAEARRECQGTDWSARPDKAETYTPLWAREDKTYRD